MSFLLLAFVCVLLNQSSGLPGSDQRSNVGIYGGHEIPIETVPYMASLRAQNRRVDFSHICGATIIHERFVMTAAHCCLFTNTKFKVVVGTDNESGDGGEFFDVENIDIHNGFDYEYAEYDVCLVKLAKPLTFGPKVARITLATPSFKVPRETNLNITGWGYTESNDVSPKLLQAQVPKVPRDKCQDIYSDVIVGQNNITSRMICAGSLGNGGCSGDSGGPLTYGNVQVGIASFVEVCGSHYPTVFTKVASVFCWVMERVYFNQ